VTGQVTTFTISAVFSLIVIYPLYTLLKREFCQSHRQWGPQSHLQKGSVPTGGGLVFVIILLLGLVAGLVGLGELVEIPDGELRTTGLLLVAVSVAFGLVGFTDDYLKVMLRSSRGFLARYKLLLQVLLAYGAVHFAYGINNTAYPLLGGPPQEVPKWLFYTLGTFLLVGLVNGVNFSDGLDGLASGLGLISALALVVIFTPLAETHLTGAESVLATACLIMAGSLLAFLIVNFKPAQIYMGDTGSYLLGAFLGIAALLGGLLYFLIPLSLVYGAEVLSVILQVIYFRLTGGKRLLLMSPLHHHFELACRSEIQTVLGFWGAHAIVCAATAVLFFKVAC
jgi:phospho-N-acetylmuramoyl-pentapeptide-transferase